MHLFNDLWVSGDDYCVHAEPAHDSISTMQDEPGYAALPEIHECLFVGNRVSATCAEVPFDRVVSTYPPVYRDGTSASGLSSFTIYFDDKQGSESLEERRIAMQKIMEGAEKTWAFLQAGERTLVNCRCVPAHVVLWTCAAEVRVIW